MLPPWSCRCSWDFSAHDLIPVYVRYLQPLLRSCPLYIFSCHGDHDPFYVFIMDIRIYLYCIWWWPHMSYFVSCLFMAIVLLCIWECSMYLQLYVEIYHCIVLMSGWFFDLGFHYSTSRMDFIMYSAIMLPLWPHRLGGICYRLFYHIR